MTIFKEDGVVKLNESFNCCQDESKLRLCSQDNWALVIRTTRFLTEVLTFAASTTLFGECPTMIQQQYVELFPQILATLYIVLFSVKTDFH